MVGPSKINHEENQKWRRYVSLNGGEVASEAMLDEHRIKIHRKDDATSAGQASDKTMNGGEVASEAMLDEHRIKIHRKDDATSAGQASDNTMNARRLTLTTPPYSPCADY